MGQNLIVTLEIFRGKPARDFDDPSKVISDHQTLKLPYGGLEWSIFMKNAKASFTRMSIKSVKEETLTHTKTDKTNKKGDQIVKRTSEYKAIDIPENIKLEVEAAMKDQGAILTPEQKRIADLEAKLDILTNGKTEASVADASTPDTTPDVNEELKAAFDEYEKLFGKPAHFRSGLKGLNEKIAAKKEELAAE